MFKVGPNPYGMCCTLGLQGKAEHPKDVLWFLRLAEEMHGRCIEFDFRMLIGADLDEIAGRLADHGIEPVISGPWPLPRLPEAFPFAKRLGARTVRTHLTPVLCGGRAERGEEWPTMVEEVRRNLKELGPMAVANDLTIAIENHQDFGSEELLEFCELGGEGIGICLDTGNPLAVAEEPAAFARRVAHKVRHIHLKDYRAQPTEEGFRLIRCTIGDGAIPFPEVAKELRSDLTASIEPGALDARHVKLLTEAWWDGYPDHSADETHACLEAAKRNAIPADTDTRTPWEKGEDIEAVCRFEMDQMTKSVQNMRALGWLP